MRIHVLNEIEKVGLADNTFPHWSSHIRIATSCFCIISTDTCTHDNSMALSVEHPKPACTTDKQSLAQLKDSKTVPVNPQEYHPACSSLRHNYEDSDQYWSHTSLHITRINANGLPTSLYRAVVLHSKNAADTITMYSAIKELARSNRISRIMSNQLE